MRLWGAQMILNGIPASEGEFKGIIRVYSKEKKFNQKHILAAISTTPEMAAEILSVGAVLTESGGLLSHAAIFCREIKKPCIVGVKCLLEKVSDGMIVKVNGKKGVIEIISNER